VVGGSGTCNWRKGVDLWLHVAAEIKRQASGINSLLKNPSQNTVK